MRYKGFWLLMLISGLWVGCSSSGSVQKNAVSEQKISDTAQATPTPSQSPRPYSKNLDELRLSFNRDKGKVRLVTLLSPT
jgi:hypothetical protein